MLYPVVNENKYIAHISNYVLYILHIYLYMLHSELV